MVGKSRTRGSTKEAITKMVDYHYRFMNTAGDVNQDNGRGAAETWLDSVFSLQVKQT